MTAAVKRAREQSEKIYGGENPRAQEKAGLLKMQPGEALRSYYQEELTAVNGHTTTTIKVIKATLLKQSKSLSIPFCNDNCLKSIVLPSTS